MNCPACNGQTKCYHTKYDCRENRTRERECLSCGERFITKEVLVRMIKRRDRESEE